MPEKQDKPQKNRQQRSKGTGSIWKNGNRFYFRTQVGGKSKCTMLRNPDGKPCTTALQAAAAAKDFQPVLLAKSKEEFAVHVATAKKIRKQSGMMLSEAWGMYLKQPNRPDSAPSTMNNHKGIFDLFMTWLREHHSDITRVAEVDQDIVKSYFADYWATGISAKRYNDVIISLRLIFRHLSEPAALDGNPFDCILKKIQETESRKDFSPEQIKMIFDGFDSGFFYHTTMETMAANGGRRKIEKVLQFKPMFSEEMRVLLHILRWTGSDGQCGCLMRWESVNFEANKIGYVRKKTRRATQGKYVELPLHPELRTALLLAIGWRDQNQRGEDYILPHIANRYKRNPSGIQKDVMKIIHCATGMETKTKQTAGRRKLAANVYSAHSFRHSFVSFLINAGVAPSIIEHFVGDGNPTLKKYYTHISEQAKREAIATLPGTLEIADHKFAELKQQLLRVIESADIGLLQKLLDVVPKTPERAALPIDITIST